MPSTLTRGDYEPCLILLHFGRGDDYGFLCRRRAYGDFQRTLHGIGDVLRPQHAKDGAHTILKTRLAKIQSIATPTQEVFDKWHRETCEQLKANYKKYGYPSFYVGHAQKWLNMTFKYIYVMGEQRLRGFDRLYDFCHVPIDKIVVKEFAKYGFQRLGCAWSRLDDYEVYLERQQWVREKFVLAPLDVEFHLWMGNPLPQ